MSPLRLLRLKENHNSSKEHNEHKINNNRGKEALDYLMMFEKKPNAKYSK